eukprot:gene21285-31413_t
MVLDFPSSAKKGGMRRMRDGNPGAAAPPTWLEGAASSMVGGVACLLGVMFVYLTSKATIKHFRHGAADVGVDYSAGVVDSYINTNEWGGGGGGTDSSAGGLGGGVGTGGGRLPKRVEHLASELARLESRAKDLVDKQREYFQARETLVAGAVGLKTDKP